MTEHLTTEPHWKVWVAVRGGILHLASRTKPQVHPDFGERIGDVTADWMPGPNGIPAYIDWTKVTAVTWRWVDTERPAAHRSRSDLTGGGERKARDVSERTAAVVAYVESIGYPMPVGVIADRFPLIKRNSLHKLLRRAAGRGQIGNPQHGRYGPARTAESSQRSRSRTRYTRVSGCPTPTTLTPRSPQSSPGCPTPKTTAPTCR